jgi:hypothetical protein
VTRAIRGMGGFCHSAAQTVIAVPGSFQDKTDASFSLTKGRWGNSCKSRGRQPLAGFHALAPALLACFLQFHDCCESPFACDWQGEHVFQDKMRVSGDFIRLAGRGTDEPCGFTVAMDAAWLFFPESRMIVGKTRVKRSVSCVKNWPSDVRWRVWRVRASSSRPSVWMPGESGSCVHLERMGPRIAGPLLRVEPWIDRNWRASNSKVLRARGGGQHHKF